MTAPARWLEKMKDADFFPREHLKDVFAAEINGERWVFATNGHLLIAERSDDPAADWSGLAGEAKRSLEEVLAPGALFGTAAVAELREWAGEPTYPHGNDCAECDGTGEFDCECPNCDTTHDCPVCDGEGAEFTMELRPGRIRSGLFNRNLVASALAEITADEVLVYGRKFDPSAIVSFRTPTQIAVVCGLNPTHEALVPHGDPENWPTFIPTGVEAEV